MTCTHKTLAEAIESAGKADPSRGFKFVPDEGVPGFGGVAGNETAFSYTAIERATARYAGALQALGLKKGDRVAVILPTNEDFILTFFGALRAGIVPVPIYPPLGLGQLQGYLDNTRHIVAKSGARVLITSNQIKRLLGTVQSSSPALEQVIAIETMRESQAPFRPETVTEDDIAFLQFTSGSTSRPKGVSLTHKNLMMNIRCIMDTGLCITREDIAVSWLPLFHDMGLIGLVLSPLCYEVPVTFLSPLHFLKRPVSWFETITRQKGSIAFAPNFAYALAVKRIREKDMAGLDLSSWRIAGCGAEPIRPETLESFSTTFAKLGFRKEALLPCYGMAEASLAIAFTEMHEGMKTLSVHGDTLWAENVAKVVPDDDEGAIRLVSCGKEFPLHEIRIFDVADTTGETPLPEGRVGEIRISGPSVMAGYWEDPEKTKETFAGKYLRTGDLGFLKDGRVYICGRSKEVVIVNGRNYYPQDIEWEASQVPGVRKGNVIAFGARDPAGDRERVVLAFEMQDTTVSAEQARTLGEQLAASVKKAVQEGMQLVLDDVVPLASGVLPKTSSGKLQRAKARELYEANALSERASAREKNTVELVKQAAISQLSYFKLAVLGGRKPKN